MLIVLGFRTFQSTFYDASWLLNDAGNNNEHVQGEAVLFFCILIARFCKHHITDGFDKAPIVYKTSKQTWGGGICGWRIGYVTMTLYERGGGSPQLFHGEPTALPSHLDSTWVCWTLQSPNAIFPAEVPVGLLISGVDLGQSGRLTSCPQYWSGRHTLLLLKQNKSILA